MDYLCGHDLATSFGLVRHAGGALHCGSGVATQYATPVSREGLSKTDAPIVPVSVFLYSESFIAFRCCEHTATWSAIEPDASRHQHRDHDPDVADGLALPANAQRIGYVSSMGSMLPFLRHRAYNKGAKCVPVRAALRSGKVLCGESGPHNRNRSSSVPSEMHPLWASRELPES